MWWGDRFAGKGGGEDTVHRLSLDCVRKFRSGLGRLGEGASKEACSYILSFGISLPLLHNIADARNS